MDSKDIILIIASVTGSILSIMAAIFSYLNGKNIGQVQGNLDAATTVRSETTVKLDEIHRQTNGSLGEITRKYEDSIKEIDTLKRIAAVHEGIKEEMVALTRRNSELASLVRRDSVREVVIPK